MWNKNKQIPLLLCSEIEGTEVKGPEKNEIEDI